MRVFSSRYFRQRVAACLLHASKACQKACYTARPPGPWAPPKPPPTTIVTPTPVTPGQPPRGHIQGGKSYYGSARRRETREHRPRALAIALPRLRSSAACRGGVGRLSAPQLSQWDIEISRVPRLTANDLFEVVILQKISLSYR